MGHVIGNRNGETILGLICLQICIDCHHVHGRKVLRSKAVPPAHNQRRVLLACIDISDIQVERLSHRSGLLRAVQNRNAADSRWNDAQEFFRGKGAEQVDLHHAKLFAMCVPVVNRLADDAAGRPHSNDDVLRISGAIIVEELVICPGQGVDPLQIPLHDAGNSLIEFVDRLPDLEKDVGTLRRAAGLGVV